MKKQSVPNNTLAMLNFVTHFRFIVEFGLVFSTWGKNGSKSSVFAEHEKE